MSEGRKIHEKYENPIDNILIDQCEKVSGYLYALKFTPNMITSIGLVIGLLSVYFMYKKNYIVAGFLFVLCYFFDCLDGYYARKYNMVTRFGDYYDHLRDVLIFSLVSFFIFHHLNNAFEKSTFVIVMSIFLFLMSVHMGCQECKTTYGTHNECLSIYKKLCPNEQAVYYSRFFGAGTTIFVTTLFILMLAVQN